MAVNLIAPTAHQSNHVSLTMSCVPFTVHVTKVSNDYTGSCPPPGNAVKFSADIVADSAADVTISWHLSNGGDSGGPGATQSIHLVAGVNTVVRSEMAYLPGTSHNDWVELDVTKGGYTAASNHVAFTVTCTP